MSDYNGHFYACFQQLPVGCWREVLASLRGAGSGLEILAPESRNKDQTYIQVQAVLDGVPPTLQVLR